MDTDTLVLSGGGTKGLILLGGLQYIYDSDLHRGITTYVGTSVGAIICYLLAIGYTPVEILIFICQNSFMEKMQHDILSMAQGRGSTSYTPINECLEKMTLDKIGRYLTLGKLREIYGKTLVCTTYNMSTCSVEYLSPDNHPDLPCLIALRMSSNIPIFFDRFKYMDNYYIDGGIVENFPILKGQELTRKKVLGLYLLIDENSLKDCPEDGILYYILRIIQVPIVQNTKYKVSVVNPDKATIIAVEGGVYKHPLDFSSKSKVKLDMFSAGYQSVRKNITSVISTELPNQILEEVSVAKTSSDLATETFSGGSQGSSEVSNGSPGVPQGSPGVPQGSPGVPQASPGVPQASPGVPQASPGVPQGSPGVPQTPEKGDGTLEEI